MATKRGFIKKTSLSEYNIRKNGLIAIILREDDELVNVELSNGENDVLLATSKGKAIRFEEKLVRNMSRATMGVTAINLQDDDRVVNMAVIKGDCEILTVTENGFGKRTDVNEYRVTGRNCKGIITHAINDMTGDIIDMVAVSGDEDLMLITSDGTIIRTMINQIRTMGRSTQGVRVMRVQEGVKVVKIATAPHEEEAEITELPEGEAVDTTETTETIETL
jgi:DNA gyrase subunit A